MYENEIRKQLKALQEADFEFKDSEGKNIEISEKGGLGLLAIGYKGIVAVRKKRMQKQTLDV